VADEELRMISAFGVRHEGGGPDGADIAYPTLVLVDAEGQLLWSHRAIRNTDRLSVDTLIEEVRRYVEP